LRFLDRREGFAMLEQHEAHLLVMPAIPESAKVRTASVRVILVALLIE